MAIADIAANETGASSRAKINSSFTEANKIINNELVEVDGSNAMTGALNMGSQKITSLAEGTLSTDAVNKGQLDASQSLDTLQAVTDRGATTTTAVSLAGVTITGTLAATSTVSTEDGLYAFGAVPYLQLEDTHGTGAQLANFKVQVYNGDFTIIDVKNSSTTRFTLDNDGNIAVGGTLTASNLSGTNTGNQTSIVGITGTKAQFNTELSDGSFLFSGDITQYTDADVRATLLTGLSVVTGGSVSATDSVLVAFGRLQNRVALNDVKVSDINHNVTTNLSFTRSPTTVTVASSDGTNAILPEATTSLAGVLGSGKWNEIVANTAKVSNVTQTISLTGGVTGSGTGSFAATVITNANLTGHITSVGNASVLGSFTVAQLSTALSDATLSGNNSGDQTSIVGITGTTAQFNTALTDGTFATSSDLGGYLLNTTDTFTGTLTVTGAITTSLNATFGGSVFINGFTNPSTQYLSFRNGFIPSASGGIGLMVKDHSGSSNDGLALYGHDGMSFYTAQVERMRIDASGNVGIGTTTPTYKLDVSGTIRATSTVTSDAFRSNADSVEWSLMFRNDANPALYVQKLTGQIASFRYGSSGAGDGTEVLAVNTTGIAVTGAITATTDLGVGVASPLAKIHSLVGSSGATRWLSTASLILESSSTNILNFLSTATAENYIMMSNPNSTTAGYILFSNATNDWTFVGSGGVTFSSGIDVTGTATATSFSGSGASLTGVIAAGTTITTVNDSVYYNVPFTDGTNSFYKDTTGSLMEYNPSMSRLRLSSIECASGIITGTPTGGTGAGIWKLGIAKSLTVTLKTTNYLEVSIDGHGYRLALVN